MKTPVITLERRGSRGAPAFAGPFRRIDDFRHAAGSDLAGFVTAFAGGLIFFSILIF